MITLLVGASDDASADATLEVPNDYPTIQGAIDAAATGDTVLVLTGTWDAQVTIYKSIALRGSDQQGTVLKNSRGSSVVKVTSSSVVITNLRIAGGPGKVGILASDATGLIVRRVTILGCDTGIEVQLGARLTIDACTIKENGGAGLNLSGSSNPRFDSVVIMDSKFDKNGGNGILLEYCTNVELDRLVVTNNGGDGIRALVASRAHLRNSTVQANAAGLRLKESHGWYVEDNLVSGNWKDGMVLDFSGSSNTNVLRRNLISDNSKTVDSSYSGVSFLGRDASNNLLEENTIKLTPIGVSFTSASGACWHNTLRLNTITKCDYGIWENAGAGPNVFLLNNLVDNNVQVASVNTYSEFDDGELGNFWSDYLDQENLAHKEGPVWSSPYIVKFGTTVYDDFPLAYRYEQDPPVINDMFPLDANVIAPGFPVKFVVEATDASAIDSYKWTVRDPDGIEYTLKNKDQTFTYTFTRTGLHWVSVMAFDVWGLSASFSEQVKVEDTSPPVAEAGPDITADPGDEFTLDGSRSTDNVGIATAHWVVDPEGLNMKFYTLVATLSMERLGSYTAVLFLVDHAGNSDSDSVIIRIKDRTPPVVDAGNDMVVDIGTKVTFDGRRSYDNVGIEKWEWAVRNDRTLALLSGEVVTYTFMDPGKFTVELRVSDAAGHTSIGVISVTVVDRESPVARAGPDLEVQMGTVLALDATASTDNIGITRYVWTFYYDHQNREFARAVATFTFELPGDYTITLTVYDRAGNFGIDLLMVTVVDTSPPKAEFWAPEKWGLGRPLTLDASGSSDNVEVTSYTWTVTHRDETKTTIGPMLFLEPEEAGTYRVTLRVKDAAGNTDVREVSLYVPPEGTEAERPAWLVPAMVVIIACAVVVSWIYTNRREMLRRDRGNGL